MYKPSKYAGSQICGEIFKKNKKIQEVLKDINDNTYLFILKKLIKDVLNELKEFKSVIRKNKTSKTIRCRCQIIIDLDESHGKVLTHEQSAKSNGVCLATVTNTVKKYFEGGIDAVTEFKRNVNSDNARRVLDGRAEARIIELACGPVPEGHSRWTIRLLEEKSKIVLDTPVSREAIRRALKKTNFALT